MPNPPATQPQPQAKPLSAKELEIQRRKEERARRFASVQPPVKRGSSAVTGGTPPKIIKLSTSNESEDISVGKVQLRNPNALKEAIATQYSERNDHSTRQVDSSKGLTITTVNEKAASTEDIRSALDATVKKKNLTYEEKKAEQERLRQAVLERKRLARLKRQKEESVKASSDQGASEVAKPKPVSQNCGQVGKGNVQPRVPQPRQQELRRQPQQIQRQKQIRQQKQPGTQLGKQQSLVEQGMQRAPVRQAPLAPPQQPLPQQNWDPHNGWQEKTEYDEGQQGQLFAGHSGQGDYFDESYMPNNPIPTISGSSSNRYVQPPHGRTHTTPRQHANSNRQVILQDNLPAPLQEHHSQRTVVNKASRTVRLSGLPSGTDGNVIREKAISIGDVENIAINKWDHYADVKFARPVDAAAFIRKFPRMMVDMSMLTSELLSQ